MTYKSKQSLSEQYDITISFINKLLNEMRETNLYGQFRIIDNSFVRINADAFAHYIRHRHAIRNGHNYEPYKGESK